MPYAHHSAGTVSRLAGTLLCSAALAIPETQAQSANLTKKAAIANASTCAPKSYPAESAKKQEQGTTKLRFHVAEDSSLIKSEIEESSGFPRLDEAALEALSKCIFRAARDENGNALAAAFTVSYAWRLK